MGAHGVFNTVMYIILCFLSQTLSGLPATATALSCATELSVLPL